ncbi:MAG: hypothetical protein MJZ75_07310 [Paludibacteraceae bacterium]|nr:hypothetical protein [Paludibacteraceae bacterium]
MKKYVFMLVAIVATMSLTGCKGEKGDPGQNVEWFITNVTVEQNKWNYSNMYDGRLPYANNYYYYEFEIPELTQFIFKEGKVSVYMIYTNDRGEEVQRPLPYVQHYEELVGYDEEDKPIYNYYTETYDYVYGNGWINISFFASDFLYEDDITIIPPTQKFRIVFNW